MPIKRKRLEQAWQYRAAKVALIALPFVLIILWLLSLLRGSAITCSVVPKYDPDLIRTMAMYFIIATVAYFFLLFIASRAFFYLVFGGIEEEERKAVARTAGQKASEIIPLIILLVILAVMFLFQMGKITLPKIDIGGAGTNSGAYGGACRRTSAEWGIPCHSVQGGVGVSGLPVPARCECPIDTEYSGTTDVVTPGGPYKICTCKNGQ